MSKQAVSAAGFVPDTRELPAGRIRAERVIDMLSVLGSGRVLIGAGVSGVFGIARACGQGDCTCT